MKAGLILGLFMFAICSTAEAHRLNEYLQATTISLGTDSVRLHVHLVVGSDVAPKVLRVIDPNGDGFISEAEQQAYAGLVLRGLSLNIDGRPASLQLEHWSYPLEEEIKKGVGDIQLYIAAALTTTTVAHHLIFKNHQEQAFSVYLVNCLLPANPNINVTGQSRNFDQSFYTLDFTTAHSIQASTQATALIKREDNRSVIKTYFFHGIRHILTGYDHLLFLCALILGAVSLWDLIKIVTAFTVAHSITLTLATLGLAHLPQSIVEPFIAASIICVAVQNIFGQSMPAVAAGLQQRFSLVFFTVLVLQVVCFN